MRLERQQAPDPYEYLPEVPTFTVTSSDVLHGEPLDRAQVHHSAAGGNQSPQLQWSGFPPATKSFAVTCFDPDAPTGSGWWHWAVANIPADVTELPRNAGSADGSTLPAGAVQFRNDYGDFGFGGAGPPPGDMPHRYFFVVHALDVEHLDLPAGTPLAVVGFHLTAHAIGRASIVGIFAH